MTEKDSEELQQNDITPEYVGLINQARTCYLNSLLQALYMTPEFRNAIVSWQYDGSECDRYKSIACQLQILFLRLMTSRLKALETTNLTASFGWTHADAWEQHDVQELWEVMFAALEKALRKSSHVGLLTRMYRGSLIEYVRCLHCHKETAREESLSSLQLAVRSGLGTHDNHPTLDRALEAHLLPETLTGNNRYQCGNCAEYCDAEKGTKILRFPYILCVQLKRFSFNYETQCRLKLNERLTFPMFLDLNSFIFQNDEEENVGGESVSGAFIYELFVIMVHSGSANGGHYYSFVKNMDDARWYCFDDNIVTPASSEHMEQAFGGTSSGWMSNTSAYMLMYRQVDKLRNQRFFCQLELPVHVQDLTAALHEDEEECIQTEIYNKSIYGFTVYWEPFDMALERVSISLKLHDTDKVQTLLDKSVQLHGLDRAERDRTYRLLKLGTSNGVFEVSESLHSRNDHQLVEVAPHCRQLLLQSFSAPQTEAEQNGISLTLHVFMLDFESCTFSEERLFGVSAQITTSQLTDMFSLRYGTKASDIRMVLEQSIHTIVLLDVQDRPIIEHCPTQTHLKLYIDLGTDISLAIADRQAHFDDSVLCMVIDRYKHTKHGFRIRLPPAESFERAGQKYPDDIEASILRHQSAQPPTPDHFIRFITFEQTDSGDRYLLIDADRRLLIADLRRKLCEWLWLDQRDCSFAKVLSANQQYDIHDLFQSLEQVATVQAIHMKIGRTLLPGEWSLAVVKFEPNVLENDWPVLFNIVVTSQSTTSQIQKLVQESLRTRQALDIPCNRIVLRERLSHQVAVLNSSESSSFAERRCSIADPLLVQLLEPEDRRPIDCISMFVRRLHPATLDCGPVTEVLIDSLTQLKARISLMTQIPPERLLITDPNLKGKIRESTFPYEVDTLVLHDDRHFAFQADQCTTEPSQLSGCVVYYRDASEVPRPLTGSERCAVNSRLRRPSLAAASAARRERALRIYAQTSSSMSFSD